MICIKNTQGDIIQQSQNPKDTDFFPDLLIFQRQLKVNACQKIYKLVGYYYQENIPSHNKINEKKYTIKM